MTDEYRRVLARWAADNIPTHLGVVKILAVELIYDRGFAGYSEWTPAEEPSFGFLVRYRNASGQELAWDSTNPAVVDETERTLSQLLTELFRIADLPDAQPPTCTGGPA